MIVRSDDRLADGGRRVFAVTKAALHRVDHLVERQPTLLMQLGREPHFCVHDAVCGEVDRGLVGDPMQRGLGLHHRERVLERREVLENVARVGSTPEPRRELVNVRRRQLPVADRIGQLDDRLRPQPAVEVVVQQHLRRRAHRLERDRARHPDSLLTRLGPDRFQ